MAKINKKQKELLSGVIAGTIQYISKEEGLPLLQAGLITVDTSNLNDRGDALVTGLTEEGKKIMASSNGSAPVAAATATPYAVIDNAVLPPSKRGFARGGGAPVQYPFDTLEIGQSFFVPVSEKHPNPVKTLGSTVSSANLRYSQETGEYTESMRAKRGAKNKLVLDDNGQKIMEPHKTPVRKPLRKFSIRPVKAGVSYGGWTAPADGALIARVQIKEG